MSTKYTVTSPILNESTENALELIQEMKIDVHSRSHIKGHIYFLFDGDEVVYIGRTTYGIDRVYRHRTEAGGYKEFDSVTMLECELRELEEMERKWIRRLKPRYNKYHR